MNHLFKSLSQFCKPSKILQDFTRRSIYLLTEFNCVDNSELGQVSKRYRKPYLIGFYRKRRTADIGDVIKVAVKGRPCRALVVATRKRKLDMTPRYDNNNIILLDDNNNPLGSRIRGPLPTFMRKRKDRFPKAVAQANRYV
ncbi:39S ribosomal protein L14, mitochondrial-like [Hydractinia symbiolongicarpus]|uniref:39S ribosomal protein L14, mitochondrial-like n=1 Tax=Hydractinia symbiolongicarpus TaxID=13093 RepID=UPI00254A2977|nr:39S ribosomal protein L14, mitochondrial-like [Hydractinia symbiolongicarpus]